MALLPCAAWAGSDPLSAMEGAESGQFPQTADASRCDRDKINKPLTLADVVDLTLCNNPQTRSLWASARAQAANVGVGMSAYLPTLSAQASASRNTSNASGNTTSYNSRNASLTAGYLLFDFGGRAATLENAKQLLLAANATRDATLQANYLGRGAVLLRTLVCACQCRCIEGCRSIGQGKFCGGRGALPGRNGYAGRQIAGTDRLVTSHDSI